MNSDLGPLPSSDRNDELEELSVKALDQVLPISLLRLRSEPGKDRGADRYLEAKHNGNDTNCRAQIQLKSMEKAVLNADGSISKSVKVSNLNYLLNGVCPLYILWSANRNELRFIFVRDEAQRLSREAPEWLKAETVTLRFARIITADSLREVHQRILAESRLSRSIHQTLACTTQHDVISVRIDPKEFSTTSPEHAFSTLISSGTTIVASGFPLEVKSLANLLAPEQQAHPKVRLVLAYAEASLGYYDSAQGHLRICKLRSQELNEDDRWFFEEVSHLCRFWTGKITHDEFRSALAELSASRPGVGGKLNALEKLREEHLLARTATDRTRMAREMRECIRTLKLEMKTSDSAYLGVRITEISLNGQELTWAFLDASGAMAIQKNLITEGMRDGMSEISSFFTRWMAWQKESSELLQSIWDNGNPILYARAAHTKTDIVIQFLYHILYMVSASWIARPKWFEQAVILGIQEIEPAVEVCVQSGCLELELRCKLCLASLYEAVGMPTEARKIAESVEGKCAAMGYDSMLAQAQGILRDDTLLKQMLRSAAERPDQDVVAAEHTDIELEQTARTLAEKIGMPLDRLQNAISDLRNCRTISQARLSWCGHIQLVQLLGHTRHVSTLYKYPTQNRCICLRFKYQGNDDYETAEDAIASFKSHFCAKCISRAPKRRASTS